MWRTFFKVNDDLPYIIKENKRTGQKLKILVDTGSTSYYINEGIYKNKKPLPIHNKV